MPLYSYICPNQHCAMPVEIMKPMAKSNRPEICPMCGSLLGRDYPADSVNVGIKEYAGGFASDSLAMSPDQIPEHQRSFPDIEVLPDGRPNFRDTKQHSDYLDKIGWDKVPTKRKRKTKLLT